MGSCAAPSAKGDDKFITTDYLQQCHLNGDDVWRNNLKLGTGKYRPLRNVDIESYKKQS
ncbi:hypothetical protein I2997_22765 [Escherichia coli]|nr:hypothetical protein [Escherichia coli]